MCTSMSAYQCANVKLASISAPGTPQVRCARVKCKQREGDVPAIAPARQHALAKLQLRNCLPASKR